MSVKYCGVLFITGEFGEVLASRWEKVLRVRCNVDLSRAMKNNLV